MTGASIYLTFYYKRRAPSHNNTKYNIYIYINGQNNYVQKEKIRKSDPITWLQGSSRYLYSTQKFNEEITFFI